MSTMAKETRKENIIKEEYLEERDTVFFIEDNRPLLSYLRQNFKNRYNFIYAADGSLALQKLKSMPKPDVIVSDIHIGDIDGFEFYDILKKDLELSDIPFIFFTEEDSKETKLKGLSQGAIDYLLKPSNIKELFLKINAIISNRKLHKESITREIKQKMLNFFTNYNEKKNLKNEDQEPKKIYRSYGITPREKEVIAFILNGWTNRDIAHKLYIATGTVKRHVENILKKCYLKNRRELVQLFYSTQE